MAVTEAVIRGLATSQAFERGKSYYHSGAVLRPAQRSFVT